MRVKLPITNVSSAEELLLDRFYLDKPLCIIPFSHLQSGDTVLHLVLYVTKEGSTYYLNITYKKLEDL